MFRYSGTSTSVLMLLDNVGCTVVFIYCVLDSAGLVEIQNLMIHYTIVMKSFVDIFWISTKPTESSTQ